MAGILTLSDAGAVWAVVDVVQRNATVGRLNDAGDVTYGTARSIGDERGAFASERDDVRDMFLRVTTYQGWEEFWPVARCMAEYRAGTMVIDFDVDAYRRATQ